MLRSEQQRDSNKGEVCPVTHSSQEIVSQIESTKFFYSSWQVVAKKSTNQTWIFHRKTDQGSRKEIVELHQLRCSSRFLSELQLWAELALGYVQDGPVRLQYLVDELVLCQQELGNDSVFTSLAEAVNQIAENGREKLDIVMDMHTNMKLHFWLQYLQLPTTVFELFQSKQKSSDEEFSRFLNLFLTFYKKTHFTLHALAQSVKKQYIADNLGESELGQQITHPFVVNNNEYSFEYDYILSHSKAMTDINTYLVGLVTTAEQLIDYSDVSPAEKVLGLQRLIKSVVGEINSGISFLSRLGYGTKVRTTSELKTVQSFDPVSNAQEPTSNGYVVHCAHQQPDGGSARNSFNFPVHATKSFLLPRTEKLLLFKNAAGGCPHPYMASMAVQATV